MGSLLVGRVVIGVKKVLTRFPRVVRASMVFDSGQMLLTCGGFESTNNRQSVVGMTRIGCRLRLTGGTCEL